MYSGGVPAANVPAANLTAATERPVRIHVRQRHVRCASRNDDRGKSADREARTERAPDPPGIHKPAATAYHPASR